MSDKISATKLAFERLYADESGVEFAVRYDGRLGEVEFESVAVVTFPVDQLNWIMAALMRISVESSIAASVESANE